MENVHPIGTGWRTADEAAQYAHLSPWSIRQAIAIGKLRSVRVAGRRSIRLKLEWVDEWLQGTANAADGHGGVR